MISGMLGGKIGSMVAAAMVMPAANSSLLAAFAFADLRPAQCADIGQCGAGDAGKNQAGQHRHVPHTATNSPDDHLDYGNRCRVMPDAPNSAAAKMNIGTASSGRNRGR